MTLPACLLFAVAGHVAPAPAAGVLVSLHPPVSVQRAGASPAPELGMRLMNGDVVVVGPGGSAMLYLAGGAIERLAGDTRFTVRGAAPAAVADRAKSKLSTEAMKASESGLWVLNDPEGSVLVAAMRGGEDEGWAETSDVRVDLLSPRYETAASRAPRFVASGGTRPAKIAVAAGKEVVWRSGPVEGSGPWPAEGLPSLDAAKVYLWRLESATGSPLSEWVPFRVPAAADAESTVAFETEMKALAASADGSAAADLLRCGRYVQTSSWTELLAASSRLLAVQPASTVAKRARDSAVRGLRLTAERADTLSAAVK